MLRVSLVLISTMVALLTASAQQRTPSVAVPKPYRPVAVTLPAPSDDASFETFRKELAAVAKGRVYAELERIVTAQGFFWDRDFGSGFDARKPAVDNLATALRLEHRDGAGWRALAIFAAEPAAAPLPARLGIVCGPGRPDYDSPDFERLMDTTRTDGTDWTYPRADQTPVRAAPRIDAAVVDTLGMHFVRMLGHAGKDNEPDPLRTVWIRVAPPSGKTGFVAPDSLTSLYVERLCYGKDERGRWRIAGFVGGGD